MTTTHDLIKLADNLNIDFFQGVFPIDLLPTTSQSNTCFIINTDRSNLPGKHWIAVIKRNGKGFCFDPLGFYTPTKLMYWMNQHCTKWSSNLRQIQPWSSVLCGLYCLHFLFFASSPMMKETNFKNIVNLMYPPKLFNHNYDMTVLDFAKLTL